MVNESETLFDIHTKISSERYGRKKKVRIGIQNVICIASSA
jgi:hypothetical protein